MNVEAASSSSECAPGTAGPIACSNCDLKEVCRLAGLIAYEGGVRRRQSSGALRTVKPGGALFRAGAPAQALYAIRQGMVKLVRMDAEGEEHIASFHTPGEVIGLEAFAMDAYACDAIALETVQCCELPLPLLKECTPKAPELAGALVQLLSRAAGLRIAPARGSARARVVNFLLDLSRRCAEHGLDATHLRLGMSRLEIASLLDTRIETVSRMLQQLHRERAIHVRGNRVRLLNLPPSAADAATA